jgi:hypothetical protein
VALQTAHLDLQHHKLAPAPVADLEEGVTRHVLRVDATGCYSMSLPSQLPSCLSWTSFCEHSHARVACKC